MTMGCLTFWVFGLAKYFLVSLHFRDRVVYVFIWSGCCWYIYDLCCFVVLFDLVKPVVLNHGFVSCSVRKLCWELRVLRSYRTHNALYCWLTILSMISKVWSNKQTILPWTNLLPSNWSSIPILEYLLSILLFSFDPFYLFGSQHSVAILKWLDFLEFSSHQTIQLCDYFFTLFKKCL